MKKLILIVIITLIFNWTSAQNIIKYKMPDGQIFSEQVYNALKQNFEKQNLEVKIIDSTLIDNTLTRIIDIKSKGYYEAKEKNEKLDPFSKFKEKIGEKFKISEFYNDKGEKFPENKLVGKPTIINFWFTACKPCIAELPYLQKLKKTYGKDLNYLAITFDDRNKVNSFLKSYDFDFVHITNSREQIKDLEITGYPMTFLLDKNGEIFNVYGGLSDFEYNEINDVILKKLL